jgi:hypothetical protein
MIDAISILRAAPWSTTYCNTILSVLESIQTTDEDHLRMMDLADYFHQQACAAREIKKKRLPD